MMDSNVQLSSRNCLDGPVAILWDIQNCRVPSTVRFEDVAGNIRKTLRVHPVIKGVVTTFSAYGDFSGFPRRLREGCQRTGVKLIDVPNGRKDAADKAILIDMFLFALENPPPSSIMLISGDVDFAPALHVLGQRGYTVILVVPSGNGVSPALCNAGAFVWDWPSVACGEEWRTFTLPPPHGGTPDDAGYRMSRRHVNENLDGSSEEEEEEEAIVYRGHPKRKSGVLQKGKEVLYSSTDRVERLDRAKRRSLSRHRSFNEGSASGSYGRTSRLDAQGSMQRPQGNQATSAAGFNEILKDSPQQFKSQPQTYCQKRNLHLPVYTCEQQGPPHALWFKCKVVVDGRSYACQELHSTVSRAEQAAAEVALSWLPGVEEDESAYKNLLQELTHERGHYLPIYKTTKSGEDHQPIFASVVKVAGKSFRGQEANNKKDAEFSAAKTAYTSLRQERKRGRGRAGRHFSGRRA